MKSPNFRGALFNDIPAHIQERHRDAEELGQETAPEVKKVADPKTALAPEYEVTAEVEAEPPKTFKRTTGTYRNPYIKEDGTEMTKWGLHVRRDFVQHVKWFMGHVGLSVSTSEFVENAVIEKINREVALRKKEGKWKSFEGKTNGR